MFLPSARIEVMVDKNGITNTLEMDIQVMEIMIRYICKF